MIVPDQLRRHLCCREQVIDKVTAIIIETDQFLDMMAVEQYEKLQLSPGLKNLAHSPK
jgi:hypothetical protein